LPTSTWSGTPCCKATETTVPNDSINPAMVDPSLGHADKDLARLAVGIETNCEIAFMSGDGEVVGDGARSSSKR
jgi:hypothetical protein